MLANITDTLEGKGCRFAEITHMSRHHQVLVKGHPKITLTLAFLIEPTILTMATGYTVDNEIKNAQFPFLMSCTLICS